MPRFDRALCLLYARRTAEIQGQFALSTSAVAVCWGRSVGNTKTRGSTGCQIWPSQTRVAFASMDEIDETVLPNLTAEDLIAKIKLSSTAAMHTALPTWVIRHRRHLHMRMGCIASWPDLDLTRSRWPSVLPSADEVVVAGIAPIGKNLDLESAPFDEINSSYAQETYARVQRHRTSWRLGRSHEASDDSPKNRKEKAQGRTDKDRHRRICPGVRKQVVLQKRGAPITGGWRPTATPATQRDCAST